MTKQAYCCVDCRRPHVAFGWYVRRVNQGGPFMKTDYLCGDGHSRQALQAQWTLLV
jgi:hypothetical protein